MRLVNIVIAPAACFQFALLPASVPAFDGDFDINEIDMVEENFLDIRAHRFRKSLDYQWYDNTSGWRMSGASLDGDVTYLETEIKLQSELSNSVNVRLELEQEVFYADKPLPYPTAEVEFYPFKHDLGFSLLGTPTYEKRNMDLGAALIWGKRPWNYLRLEYVEIDSLYNQKNAFDETSYTSDPYRLGIEGAYNISHQYKLRFNYNKSDDLIFVDPAINGEFTHKSDEYSIMLDYLPSADEVIGIKIKGFDINKQKTGSGENQQQQTDYLSTDIYWVTGMHQAYEISLGVQYDQLTNRIHDRAALAADQYFNLHTMQLYSTLFHPFNKHMAWDLGLFLGDVEKHRRYTFDPSADVRVAGFQGKFRSAFIYRSADGRSTLQFSLSLDLDELFTEVTDGGGISFQTVF